MALSRGGPGGPSGGTDGRGGRAAAGAGLCDLGGDAPALRAVRRDGAMSAGRAVWVESSHGDGTGQRDLIDDDGLNRAAGASGVGRLRRPGVDLEFPCGRDPVGLGRWGCR